MAEAYSLRSASAKTLICSIVHNHYGRHAGSAGLHRGQLWSFSCGCHGLRLTVLFALNSLGKNRHVHYSDCRFGGIMKHFTEVTRSCLITSKDTSYFETHVKNKCAASALMLLSYLFNPLSFYWSYDDNNKRRY